MSYEPIHKPSAAGRIIGLTARTIRRYCQLGHISAEKLPSGHYLIPDSELHNFKKKNRERFADQLTLF